ncbi:MAG: serine/threonine-protein phosphatase [Acidobacteriota bacterium]|nr:MAG: serine/threonine-protein phosphatase [Acidobacteriota bacterium]
MADFDALFDLDHRLPTGRLGDLIECALHEIDLHTLPDWGEHGRSDRLETITEPSIAFRYTPHLFPDMDLKLRLAHKLQFHLLPRQLPEDAPVSIAACMESYCHLSGDLFGWEILSDGKLLLWILDVSGHGVRAGLASAMLRVVIDNLRQRSRVDALAGELNDVLMACIRPEHETLYITRFFIAIAEDGSSVYTSAGHQPMLVQTIDGDIRALGSNSMPIGMVTGASYRKTACRLAPSETLLLYTDGLLEALNDPENPLEQRRLRTFLGERFETPEALTCALFDLVTRHQDLTQLDDDISFIAARLRA